MSAKIPTIAIIIPTFLEKKAFIERSSCGPERVVEIIMGDLLSQFYPRFGRTAIVQSRPQSCLDDFTPQLLRRIAVAYGVKVSRQAISIEAVNIQAEMLCPQNLAQHLCHR